MKNIAWFIFLMTACSVVIAECPPGEKLIAECVLPGAIEKQAMICYRKEKPVKLSYYFNNNEKTELEVNFGEKRKLSRWVDEATYTRYLWFTKDSYQYVIGVPQETPDAVAFLWVIRNNDKVIMSKNCLENSFGDKDERHPYIKDVSSTEGESSGFPFMSVK